MYWIVMLWCVTMMSILMARECSLDGARAPFFENAYDGLGIKKELEGVVLPVRPFAEEEEEYRKEFAGTG